MNDAKLKRPVFEPARIRDISLEVYKLNLIRDSGEGAPERMLAKDADCGLKMRGRAAAYDKLTRAYLKVLGIEP
ncbi:hypothetical protein [Bradyrhizobium sp. URHD0069]|uniref:hypothetical protein n=1 Tax=Bradyrhizobium sp. URHD0069 TaxID=1380355 RepID=UPI000495F5B0|nr:hypothetical protein [Bradyrhizobium sp. URHD0069]